MKTLNAMSIRRKMMISILGITITIYLITFGFISITLKQRSIEEAEKLINTSVSEKAHDVMGTLNETMAISRNLAAIVKEYVDLPQDERLRLQKQLLLNTLENNPEYEVTWLSWDLQVVDSTWKLPHGRERSIYYRNENTIKERIGRADTTGEDINGFYYKVKMSQTEELVEPYDFDKDGLSGSHVALGTSSVVPIMKDGEYLGQIGSDITLKKYMSTTKYDLFEKSHAFLLSNEGTIVAHPNTKKLDLPYDSLGFEAMHMPRIDSMMKNGEENISFYQYDKSLNEEFYVAFANVPIGRSGKPWLLGIMVPVSEVTRSFDATFSTTVMIGVLGLLLLAFVTYYISNVIINSLKKTNGLLKALAEGNLTANQKLAVNGNDEINQIASSVNNLMDELTKKAEFAAEIGLGNLTAEFEESGANDALGTSLLKMRDNLHAVIEETNTVVMRAGVEGELDTKIDTDWKSGAWKDFAETINRLISSIANPVIEVNKVVNAMAAGDLTLRFETDAKGDILLLSNNLNKALDNLNRLLLQIAQNTIEVRNSSFEMLDSSKEMYSSTGEIASSISEMSNGAQNQVMKVEESSLLIEGILKSSNNMRERASSINNSVQNVVSSSEEGKILVEEVVSNMVDISKYSGETNDSIKILTERSTQITRVLGVITEIASQTNLLALNAAIEAAQAGDAGRGFAVVAEEIRKLAEDSRKSAGEIENLINDVQNDIQVAAKTIEKMNLTVITGEKSSKNASSIYEKIASHADMNLTMTQEIVNATQEQTKSINDVVIITEGVVVIAEQTAAGTEEAASSASQLSKGMGSYAEKTRRLSDIAALLKNGVDKFKLTNQEHELFETLEQEETL